IQSVLNSDRGLSLSEFDGKLKTKDWNKTPAFPTPPGQGSGGMKWVSRKSSSANAGNASLPPFTDLKIRSQQGRPKSRLPEFQFMRVRRSFLNRFSDGLNASKSASNASSNEPLDSRRRRI